MFKPQWVIDLCSIALIGVAAGVLGQDFPNRPIRIITSGAGGGPDLVSRIVAQGISPHLGQQAVVVNQPSGVIPGEVVARAAPDGYTLLVLSGSFWIGPLFAKTPYDPIKDFVPVSLLSRSPNILVVHPSLPVKSVKDLIALAKARPGELNYSSGSNGSSSHLSGELLNAMAGISIVRIVYKSAASEMADLVGGHIQMTFGSTSSVMPHVKSGRLRALAVTSAKPTSLAPDLPTMAAGGLPGYEWGQLVGMFAPAKVPEPIISRINQEIARFVHSGPGQELFLRTGVEPVGSSPADLATTIKSEISRLGKVIKEASIRVE